MNAISELIDEALGSVDRCGGDADALGMSGLPTGLVDLDRLTGGLRAGQLTVIAGRPGVGKTALALTVARHAAVQQHETVLLAAPGADPVDLTLALLAPEARIDLNRLRNGDVKDFEQQQLNEAAETLRAAPLHLVTGTDLQRTVERASELDDLGVLIVDPETSQDGHAHGLQHTETLLATCRRTARRLEVPVITTTQVSRRVERRFDSRPMLSDLSGTPSVEEIADLVITVYRDEMYDPDTPDRGTAQLEVLKHRWGPTGTVKTAFIGPRCAHRNLARPQPHR